MSNDDWVTVANSKKKKEYKKPSNQSWSDSTQNIPKKNNNEAKSLSIENKDNYLNDTWVLWFHDMKNPDWTLNGYQQLFTFNTVEDFWRLYNNVTDLTNGMYYLMRKDIPPIWDDPKNINGGAWTFKVDKRDLNKVWEDLSCYCVGETICEHPETIVGVSISPKIRNATVRVWTTNTDQSVNHFKNLTKDTQTSNTIINFNEARFTPNKQASI